MGFPTTAMHEVAWMSVHQWDVMLGRAEEWFSDPNNNKKIQRQTIVSKKVTTSASPSISSSTRGHRNFCKSSRCYTMKLIGTKNKTMKSPPFSLGPCAYCWNGRQCMLKLVSILFQSDARNPQKKQLQKKCFYSKNEMKENSKTYT